ncbi:MAG: bifunctional DNA-formamidopyrimidine glycosylase/DNA-(apurinic or apyrimidinic site) lyase [Methylocystis sp.]
MPELPEVETVRRGLAPAMINRRIAQVELRRKDLRFPFPLHFTRNLMGREILTLRRRAKYLLADLDDAMSLIMHLGMSGSFRIEEETPGNFFHTRNRLFAHDHVTFYLSNGQRIIYNDPRRFGFMLLIPTAEIMFHPYFSHLGVEPLSDLLNAEFLARAFYHRKTSVKSLLLDQHLIAGIGNIYACEALHEARISPLRQGGDLVTQQGKPAAALMHLPKTIKNVLEKAISAGGSSLRDYRQTNGAMGYFQHQFKVYGRENETCYTCGKNKNISRFVQSGRSTFYCPGCQK